MSQRKLSKEEVARRLCAAMLRATDDHRLTAEMRARAERHVRNLRAIQKRVAPGSGPMTKVSEGRPHPAQLR